MYILKLFYECLKLLVDGMIGLKYLQNIEIEIDGVNRWQFN